MKKFTLTLLLAFGLLFALTPSSNAGVRFGVYVGPGPGYYAPAPYYYDGPYYGGPYYGGYYPRYYHGRHYYGHYGHYGHHWH